MRKITIAGVSSGVGKTTISLGLMRALMKRGKNVQPFKVGPDYLDPMYHRFVTGNISKNLDEYMLDDEQIKFVFKNSMIDKDIAVIEGVMGLYDGIGDNIDRYSTSAISKLLKSPVILIIDGRGVGASAAAMVLGYKNLDKNVEIVGVIANNVRTKRHYDILKSSIEKHCGVEVLGYLPPTSDISLKSRHLGLLPSNEVEDLEKKVEMISDLIEEYIDVDRIVDLSEGEVVNTSFELSMFTEDPEILELARGKKIALAYDEAFNFYYQDNLDLLESIGVEIVRFSPLHDTKLPEADMLYIGGGYPEEFADILEKNIEMRRAIKKAHDENFPIYAECGGLMYLGNSLVDKNGRVFEMVGAIDGQSKMTDSLKRFGYCIATSKIDNLIVDRGQDICGHEFHHSIFETDLDTVFEIRKIVNSKVLDEWSGGYFVNNTLASYIHIHFYNNLSIVCYILSNIGK